MNAPEFPQNLIWLNTEPLTMQQLQGRPVLIDFWTYSCVNCIRTLPHLKEWYDKYNELGLVIIGVHAPEFDFEKEEGNVRDAVARLHIEYPVVLDSEHAVWNLYANNVWPRKFLVDAKGVIVYDHAGEGGYEETERAIQKIITDIHPDIQLPEIIGEEGLGGVCYPTTPETYLGQRRGRAGAPGEKNQWHTEGAWKSEGEYIEHADSKDATLVMNFEAVEVNLVMEAPEETSVAVLYDGKPLAQSLWGHDVVKHQGVPTILVKESRMYNIIATSHADTPHKLLTGDLTLRVTGSGLRIYAFTFGGCT